jgi:neopullulanase
VPAPDPGSPGDAPAWVRDAVFYQIFPDRFAMSRRVPKPGTMEDWSSAPTARGFKGGDLLGVVEHLDYLVDLGVTALYLNPVFQSASNHRYHTYDHYEVDPLLGGNAALRELLDGAHRRGLRVVLDGVFNHVGRGFWPFHHVLETGKASPYRGWFYLDDEALDADRPIRAYPPAHSSGAVTVGGDGASGIGSLRAYGYRAWWDLPALPKLNVDNPEVREYLLGVAEHWIRFGADGWRLDVALEIADPTFWQEFRRRVKAVRPDVYIVAEVWNEDPNHLLGDQFDAYMNYPLAASITSFAAGPHLDRRVLGQHISLNTTIYPIDGAEFARRLEHGLSIYGPPVADVQLNLVDSHDTPRFLAMTSGDKAALRLAILLQMTLPGAPSIYYGDEIGMTGEQDPACRASFPWQDPDAWDHDLRAFTKGAIAARHANAALRGGPYRTIGAWDSAMSFTRGDVADGRGAPMVVAVNAGDRAFPLEVDLTTLPGRRLVPVSWPGMPDPPAGGVRIEATGRATIAIPPRSGYVFRAER